MILLDCEQCDCGLSLQNSDLQIFFQVKTHLGLSRVALHLQYCPFICEISTLAWQWWLSSFQTVLNADIFCPATMWHHHMRTGVHHCPVHITSPLVQRCNVVPCAYHMTAWTKTYIVAWWKRDLPNSQKTKSTLRFGFESECCMHQYAEREKSVWRRVKGTACLLHSHVPTSWMFSVGTETRPLDDFEGKEAKEGRLDRVLYSCYWQVGGPHAWECHNHEFITMQHGDETMTMSSWRWNHDDETMTMKTRPWIHDDAAWRWNHEDEFMTMKSRRWNRDDEFMTMKSWRGRFDDEGVTITNSWRVIRKFQTSGMQFTDRFTEYVDSCCLGQDASLEHPQFFCIDFFLPSVPLLKMSPAILFFLHAASQTAASTTTSISVPTSSCLSFQGPKGPDVAQDPSSLPDARSA